MSLNITTDEFSNLSIQRQAHEEAWRTFLHPHLDKSSRHKVSTLVNLSVNYLSQIRSKQRTPIEAIKGIIKELAKKEIISSYSEEVIQYHIARDANELERLKELRRGEFLLIDQGETVSISIEHLLESSRMMHQLNNLISALYFAKYARFLIQQTGIKQDDPPTLDYLLNAYLLESMTLRALSLYREAYQCIQELKQPGYLLYVPQSGEEPQRTWQYRILHEEIQAAIGRGIRNWTITEIERLGDEMMLIARNTAEEMTTDHVMIQAYLAKSTSNEGDLNLKSAVIRIERLIRRLESTPQPEPGDQLLTYKLASRVLWQCRDWDRWEYYLHKTIPLILQTANRVQLKQICHDYDDRRAHLNKIFEAYGGAVEALLR